MLKERVPFTTKEQPPQPLDSSFLIQKEINALRNEPDFTYDEQRVYLYDQKIHFLNEHAGYTDISTLKGHLTRDGRLTMSGVNMNASWEKTIAEYGLGSREHYEIIGWQKAVQKLTNDEVDCVVISSPQKGGFNRRFTFVLLREGETIIQLNAMHKGADVSLDRASDHYRSLQFLSGNPPVGSDGPQTINKILTQPIAFTLSPDTLNTIFDILGITEEKQIESKKYEETIRTELAEMIEEYMTIMQGLIYADIDNKEDEYAQTLLMLAEKYRDALYMKAEYIKKRLGQKIPHDTKTVWHERVARPFANSFEEVQYLVSTNPRPQIHGGVSCPTRGASMDISDLLRGNTMHTVLLKKEFGSDTTESAKDDPNLCRCSKGGGPHFHCPGKIKDENGKETDCKHPIVVGEGITKCPTCGMGKQC